MYVSTIHADLEPVSLRLDIQVKAHTNQICFDNTILNLNQFGEFLSFTEY